MKRFICVLLTVILALGIAGTAFAAQPRVIDEAELLSGAQEKKLEGKIEDIADEFNFDVVILTVEDTDGMRVSSFADDYYDYHEYGYDEEYSGILMLVNMAERDWYISTTGYGIYAFTDYGIEWIYEDVRDHLSDGEYYEAFDRALDSTSKFLKQAQKGEPYDSRNPYRTPGQRVVTGVIMVAIAFVIGLIVVAIMKKRMKTAVKNNLARDYVRPGSFVLTKRRDTYLYSNISRIKIQSESSRSGGGSSIHIGSSGRSHGGGGGKF